ncbi:MULTISPECIES: host attachment protein [unclassified Lentilitoribacter]|jgi:protein required for attachment to host cells|uniref:host attachment protein n=1 Tax=unclassified Lentilitoribacter TaxID=2647570 RepID=UPI0013A708C9|nr:host attachment protein [Lentilitoribacter sp. Alg239-R112]
MKAAITWILVANGERARIFEVHGVGNGLNELTEREIFADLDEKHTDQKGRTFSSTQYRRSALEPHEELRNNFVIQIVEQLETWNLETHYDRLIICAAPNILGQLRKEVSGNIRAKISAEIPKNMVSAELPKLMSLFGDYVAL